MPSHPGQRFLGRLRQSLVRRDGGGLADEELLERIRTCRDEDAFAALVGRYGPMVLGVCRRLLGHAQDAEDAFQATFLVLARRAASIRKPQAVASWLQGVAYRTALEARSAARRRATERQVPALPEPAVQPTGENVQPVLDAEL